MLVTFLKKNIVTKYSMTKAKIFCIGLHKTWPSSLHDMASHSKFKSTHSTGWLLDNWIISNFNFFCDGGSHYDNIKEFKYIALSKQYPDAKFIISIRDLEPWIISKLKHGGWDMNTTLVGDAEKYRHVDWRIKSKKKY